ncbi:MAG: Asp-tRNA(Asn)/Glu-tRNA(Gln) amidotransferase subunit GatC [Betaproteobacteria bacterium]|nr:MAG: Asp-tRNA(Asn)/Glu-tRNA(Gln) amidotransferase subunit GatC [Betaproteobacteria bacterium]
MALTHDDVCRVAQLARLRQDEAQARSMLTELNRIFALMEQMQAVDTSAVEPMSHPRDVAQRLRADQVTEPNRRDALLALAPRSEAGLYLVPKVIE